MKNYRSSALNGTLDKGTIFKPVSDLSLDLWVDADFAGLWNSEDSNDPDVARSRTGYVVTLGGIPIIWKSKLQTDKALSTCEAEYIAASQGMRELLPIRRVLKDICQCLNLKRARKVTVSTVWEDKRRSFDVDEIQATSHDTSN